MAAMPENPVTNAAGTSLSGNGPSATPSTKNTAKNSTFVTSKIRKARFAPSALPQPIARARSQG
jgi:hypothetical protein